jgi:hypothetical protein
MKNNDDWPTFSKDEWRKVCCVACKRIIGETHLGEKNKRITNCKNCHNVTIIFPPRVSYTDSYGNQRSGAYWTSEDNCIWTAIPRELVDKYIAINN